MDLLDLDRRACELNIKLLKEMSRSDLSMATPCAEWNVRELVQHQVDTTATFTSEVRGTTITGAPVGNDPLGVYTGQALLPSPPAEGQSNRCETGLTSSFGAMIRSISNRVCLWK